MAIFDFLRKIKEKTIGRVNLKRELPLLRKRFYDEITDFTGFKGAYSKKNPNHTKNKCRMEEQLGIGS